MWSSRSESVSCHCPLGATNHDTASYHRNYHNYLFVSFPTKPCINRADFRSAVDVPFVVRIVIQGLLPGLPPDLSLEAQILSASMNTALPGLDQDANGITELCPACHVEVPLMDITRAVCDNGHVWGMCYLFDACKTIRSHASLSARCSITSFILATPVVRTCIGCSRKAFLPLSRRQSDGQNWLPTAAQSWIVEELLEAVNCCLFCGNSFVSIL